MEEVDNIIIHSLREIGCEIDESIANLASFNTELIVEATVRCIDIIKPGMGLSTVLPSNMAARFRYGAMLAQTCADLGYRGDIGYQTFLYSSEADLRKVFMFLMERLPKESEKALNEPMSKSALLEKAVASTISRALRVSWLPYYCHKKGLRNRGRASVPFASTQLEVASVKADDVAGYQEYCIHHQQTLANQLKNQETLLPSVICQNAKSIQSSVDILEKVNWLNSFEADKTIGVEAFNSSNGVRGLSRADKAQTVENTAKEADTTVQAHKQEEPALTRKKDNQELEVERMKTECEGLKTSMEVLQDEIKKLNTTLTQVSVTYQNEEKELKTNEEQKKLKARTYDLYQDGEENMKKLDSAIEAVTSKLISLACQWEKHIPPLVQKYRQDREKHSTKASASQKKLDQIKLLKETEKDLQEEYRNKDQQYLQLVTEVQKLPKEINRSAYTQRILEIINNVRKQRDEIDKVLVDTRSIQKEINTLTGRLERSFTVVDDLIFRDARTNEASRKAYKLLVTLHSDCSELVRLVEETGAVVREIRDLEEQIDTESTKNVGANLERITADLKQMKQETAALTVQLQTRAS